MNSQVNLVFDFYFILAENNLWQGSCLTVFIVSAYTGELKSKLSDWKEKGTWLKFARTVHGRKAQDAI